MIDRTFYAAAIVACTAAAGLAVGEQLHVNHAQAARAAAPQVVHLDPVVITAPRVVQLQRVVVTARRDGGAVPGVSAMATQAAQSIAI
jgi:hypothetical protein